MIAPMPGAVPLKPGSGTLPMPGVIPDIVDLQRLSEVGHGSRRLSDHPPPVARHDPHHLGRSGALQGTILEPAFPARISPATPRAAITTVITGCWAASTT